MKNKLNAFIIMGFILFYGCKPDPYAAGPTITPACNTETEPLTLYLDFSGTYYLCTAGNFGNHTPPNATGFNYLSYASVNGTTGSLSNPLSYLCEIHSKTDENATHPCSNPGTLRYTWSTAGASLTGVANKFKNYNTDVTVDYYDICSTCNSTIPDARPYFSTKIALAPGITVSTFKLVTQNTYIGQNGGCQ